MVGPISFWREVCDDHKSVIFVLYKILRIIVFLFQHKLLYFFLKKVSQGFLFLMWFSFFKKWIV